MTIGQIDRMPHAEFLEWQEYYLIEPFGIKMHDMIQAHSVSVLANVNRNSEKRPQPYTIQDFMLFEPKQLDSTEPTVEGKTATQWKLIFAAESLAASQQMNKSTDP